MGGGPSGCDEAKLKLWKSVKGFRFFQDLEYVEDQRLELEDLDV